MRSPTTHAFHESLRYACKTRTKLHVPAFSNRSDSEAPAMETRYIRFANDYICNRDGLSFRGALITGLDPPRLLAFVPLPPFLSRRSSFNAPLVDAIRDSFSNENFLLLYLLLQCNQLNEFSSTVENYQNNNNNFIFLWNLINTS